MSHYTYLIIGGGMTADAAAKGIRQIDQTGSIGIISSEADAPYKRPPLTKQLWKGKPESSIWLNTSETGAVLHYGRTARELNTVSKLVVDDVGTEYTFDKLLLATGGIPRRLPFDSGDTIYYRTFADYRNLRNLTQRGDKFAVIGGGFIGWEIAAALAMNDKQVTMIFPDDAIGARIYPKDLAHFLNSYYREHGIEIITGDTAVDMAKREDNTIVRTKYGFELEADGVVAGIGITPNTQLAESSGLKIDNGIVVDEYLHTSHPDIYSAGDVANFYNPVLNKRMRVEHEDNAVTMGNYAGRIMAGDNVPYHHIPYFYSDLFDLGYEAVGEVNSALETISDWKEPFQEGVVYYIKEGRVRGVLLWNVWDKVDEARSLLAEPGLFSADNLKGRITN